MRPEAESFGEAEDGVRDGETADGIRDGEKPESSNPGFGELRDGENSNPPLETPAPENGRRERGLIV